MAQTQTDALRAGIALRGWPPAATKSARDAFVAILPRKDGTGTVSMTIWLGSGGSARWSSTGRIGDARPLPERLRRTLITEGSGGRITFVSHAARAADQHQDNDA